MRRALPTLLPAAAVAAPLLMQALAYLIDRGNVECFAYWSDGEQSAYNWLLGGSVLLAAALPFAPVARASARWWHHVLAP